MRAKLCALDRECCTSDGDTSERHLDKFELDAESTLYLLQCTTFGYNGEVDAWVSRHGGEPKPAPFAAAPTDLSFEDSPVRPPDPGDATSSLTAAWFDGGRLHSTYCVRGLCDAGSEVEYTWSGSEFRLARLRSRNDDCCSELDQVGPWPILWPATERCDYRWEVIGKKVTLVSVTPKGDRKRVVKGLPTSCTVESDGAILECDGSNIPVTSAGDNWVVWLRSGSMVEPGEARVHVRIPRGCAL